MMPARRDVDPDSESTVVGVAYLAGVALGSVTSLLLFPFRLLDSESAPKGCKPEGENRSRPKSRRRARSRKRRRERAAVDSAGARPAPNREIAAMAEQEGYSALARELADPDPSTRRLALRTVGELAPERAAPLLAGLLHDPEPSVRCAAAAVAARTRASGVVFSLILALDDSDPEVRAAAALSIEEITGKVIDGDVEDPTERRALIERLKTWWKEQRFAELATGETAR
jgi:hypothetical protein